MKYVIIKDIDDNLFLFKITENGVASEYHFGRLYMLSDKDQLGVKRYSEWPEQQPPYVFKLYKDENNAPKNYMEFDAESDEAALLMLELSPL